MVTQELLKELYEYKDGAFFWKNTGKKHKPTPITEAHRYARLVVNKKAYMLHRLIFLYHHGYFPKIVDHINNNRENNAIENLRETTQEFNCLNRITPKSNKAGCKNVHWHQSMKKWCVLMSVNRKRKIIGYFEDFEFAELVADEARQKFHGAYARR
jgi:ubiquinone/menaquinone biosynthesis C-methylase UbiE